MQMETASFDQSTIGILDRDHAKFWSMIEPILDESAHVWKNLTTKDTLHKSLHDGDLVAWGAIGKEKDQLLFLCITMLVSKSDGDHVRVVFQGGDELRTYRELLVAKLEYYARAKCCVGIEFMGPKGQDDFLLDLGYFETEVLIAKPLSRKFYH